MCSRRVRNSICKGGICTKEKAACIELSAFISLLSAFFRLDFGQGDGELVGAASSPSVAIDSFEAGDDIIDFHPLDKGGDTLKIAVASANDLEIDNGIVIVNNAHLPRANALRLENIGFLHKPLGDDGPEDVVGLATDGVALIGIDVHGKRIGGGDADDDIAEDGIAANAFRDLNADDLAIGDAKFFGIGRGHMDVTLGDDEAAGDINGVAIFRIAESAARGAGGVARFPDGDFGLGGTGFGHGDLDLVVLAAGSENAEALQFEVFFGDGAILAFDIGMIDDVEADLGGELARLGEVFDVL